MPNSRVTINAYSCIAAFSLSSAVPPDAAAAAIAERSNSRPSRTHSNRISSLFWT